MNLNPYVLTLVYTLSFANQIMFNLIPSYANDPQGLMRRQAPNKQANIQMHPKFDTAKFYLDYCEFWLLAYNGFNQWCYGKKRRLIKIPILINERC